MHAQHALSLGSETSNSESIIIIFKKTMRSTPLGADLQQHFREADLRFMRRSPVVFAEATAHSQIPSCYGPTPGSEVRLARPEFRISLGSPLADRLLAARVPSKTWSSYR